YLPFLDEPVGPNEREQAVWENRLDYSIGRVELRLIGTLSKANMQDRLILLFQVRRLFGAI
ncbi:MAG: hypothetical protein OES09_12170, partial [Gammaproteobacteria bacterium]|nr:hypothetical protein [Gammaproteobacteria bacterium]